MFWKDATIHFLDFEGNNKSGILEYGVVSCRGESVVASRTRYCRASGPVSEDDFLVHGIRREDTVHSQPIGEDWDFFATLRETGPLAAHYASVENHLIRGVWPFSRMSPDFLRAGRNTIEWGPWIDTARLYLSLYRGLDSLKLESLVDRFGLQEDLDREASSICPENRCRYHCALYDALASALLVRRLLREPLASDRTLGWMLESSVGNARDLQKIRQQELF